MKVGNFTPNCMPAKIAQMNTKVELFTRLLFVEESIRQDIIKEVKQKVSELYERTRPCMPYKIKGENVIRAVCIGDH